MNIFHEIEAWQNYRTNCQTALKHIASWQIPDKEIITTHYREGLMYANYKINQIKKNAKTNNNSQ